MYLPGHPFWDRKIKFLISIAKRYGIVAAVLFVYFLFTYWLTDSPCLFRLVTGLPCPGCGLTRATLALMHLDFTAAFRFHPMIFVVLPVSLFVAVQKWIRKKPVRKHLPVLIVLGCCLFLVYLVRMFFYFPETEPMTYDIHSIAGRILHVLGLI